MATGFSRSIEGGHDVVYDYCCTPCEGKGLNAEANFYCKACGQLFCETCETFHDKFFRTHKVLGRKEVSKWGNVKPVGLLCDEHPGKELEMYCEDHDLVCCHTCISVKHRACKQVKLVSEVAKGIQQKQEFKSVLSKAATTQSKLKSLHDKQEKNIKLLQESRSKIMYTLKDMRKKFKQTIDRLEEDSMTEMDRLHSLLTQQVTLDKETSLDIHDKIQKLLDDIQNLGKQCDELAFQSFKKCSEQISNAKNLLSFTQNVTYQLQFTPDAKIEQYLLTIESLGKFHVTPKHDNTMYETVSLYML